jgi:hypothetical protein
MPSKAEAAAATETILVTEQNFRTAESDKYFAQTMKRAGGIGKFLHLHELDPIDQQPYIRANRDTLLSAALFDLDAGPVTITLPETGGRFMSSIAINEEHYAVETVYAPGSFTYDKRKVGTRYVLFGIRIFADQNEYFDLEKAYLLQANVNVHQPNGPGTFKLPAWDRASQKKVRAELIRRAAALPDTKNMFGPKGKVDPERHLLGTATGWGRSAPEDVLYLTGIPARNDGKTIYKLTIKGDVPVDGFWSISVYGPDGYFHKNDRNVYSINNITAKKDADDSITIQFGGCDEGPAANCIPITEGWDYWTRLYRPRKELLDGSYKFPEPQPVS